MKLLKFPAYLTLILLLIPDGITQPVYAQNDTGLNAEYNFGINVIYHIGKGQNFPGMRLFGGMSVTGSYDDFGHANYGLSLSIYTNTLGSDYSLLHADYQVDLVNALQLGWGNENIEYRKYLRTLHNSPYFNMVIPVRYAAYLGTNFILNSSGRHQVNGTITLSADRFSLHYYNDGAPPFAWIGLSDGFDRYWTGGVSFYLHSDDNYNILEFSHDQFTEYSPMAYEFANVLGIDVMSYPQGGAASFNNASYNLRVSLLKGVAVDVGVNGSLRSSGRAWGLQDIIHILGKYPLHPNREINRFYYGTTLMQNL